MAALTAASNKWSSLGRRPKSGGSLVLLTLEPGKPVTGVTSGDFLEDNTQRMKSMTVTNSYWHNIGMRVMIEGIALGSFTHNQFEGVDGGLAIVSDPYWAQGGTCQNVTVDNNIFLNCKNDGNSNAFAPLVLGPYWGSGGVQTGQSYSFQNYTVTNNTFTASGGRSLYAHMVGQFNIKGNLIVNGLGYGIEHNACGAGSTLGNSIVHNNGAAISTHDSAGISITENYLDNFVSPTLPFTGSNNTNVTMTNNTLVGTIPFGTTISLKAVANGQYVCADNTGTSPLIANRTTAGVWEQYTVFDAGNGNVGLQAHANNKYVCADRLGASPLIANRTAVGLWESFQWINLGSSNIGLKARANDHYVSADLQLTNPPQLIADETGIGTWETFLVTQY